MKDEQLWDAYAEGRKDANDELLDAAQKAANVLFLLADEVQALGFRAARVRDDLRAAIAKNTTEPF